MIGFRPCSPPLDWKGLPMLKSSTTVTLALIGTSFFLAGCGRDDDENNQVAGSRGGGVYTSPRVGAGSVGRGSSVGATPSARGGFGSTGASGVGS